MTVTASVIGYLVDNAITNLDHLIQIPSGCGEQNMILLAPNILALAYLNITNKLTEIIKTNAINNIRIGYITELTYKLADGSFSAFGTSDGNGSTWLTSFVVKTFIQAKEFAPSIIDPIVIDIALNFVISKQQVDGSFKEDGRVIHKDMQGASGDGLALTCYAAITLQSSLKDYPANILIIQKTLDYIYSKIDVTNVYELCVCIYSLKINNYPNLNSLESSLIGLGIETASELHWEKSLSVDPTVTASLSIEMSGYALLYFQAVGATAKAVKILKWLLSKQNAFGGYTSTQDTVIGLQAITTMAVLFSPTNTSINSTLTPDVGKSFNANIDKSNAVTVQNFEVNLFNICKCTIIIHFYYIFKLPFNTRSMNVKSNGTGFALVQLSSNFFVIENQTNPSFIISLDFEGYCIDTVKYNICLNYIPKSKDDVSSNMIVALIQIPSGYEFEKSTINGAVVRVS